MTTTTIAKADRFTKGDRVTVFGDWDRKGTVNFTQAIVYSCGGKQMVLTSAQSGHELGRHYHPAKVQPYIVPEMTEAEAHDYALTLAAALLAERRAHLNRCLERNSHLAGYVRAIREDIDALHEPRSYFRPDAGHIGDA
jgi:hypothetical protein